MCLAAGIIGAAVVGGVGSAIAGNQAAKATEGATNAAINEQNKALQQQQQLNAPYQSLATGNGTNNIGAIQQYENLLGLNPTVNPQQALQNTPGYQFAQQQGTQNTVNQASAMGLGLSGNTLQGLSQFNAGLADTTYQNAVGNAQNAVAIGQASASNQAANLGQAGANVSNALINQGNINAGIYANEAAGITKAIGNTTEQLVGLNTDYALANPNTGYTLQDLQSIQQPQSPTFNQGPYTLNNPAYS